MSMPVIQCTNCDKCCVSASVVQSIALEEAAISCILNAEAEKLQKALSQCCSTKELLEVNKSVESMVEKITSLEVVLKSKLDLVIPILEECGRKPMKPECDE